jgi:alkaline phosphatase D
MSQLPQGSKMQLYRSVPFGNLVQFAMVDTRQFRTDQPCGDGTKPICEAVHDTKGTMMGEVQESWLKGTLDKSQATWNIIGNQVLMARIDMKPGPDETLSMDSWSGYEKCQERLMKFLAERKPSNPIVITGDIHSNWVNDLKVDWKNEKAAVVGTEFVGTSISSGGDGVDERPTTQDVYRENQHLKMFNGRRGYVTLTLTPERCQADYRIMPYVTKPDAPIRTHSSWMLENGRRGVVKV